MVYKGKVLDENGSPLIGATVITVFDRADTGRKAGTITDFDGQFIIGDARSDESWKITHIGYEEQFFNIPRNEVEKTFVLKLSAFELDEIILTPRTPGISPDNPATLDSGIGNQFQEVIKNLPSAQKKSFLDTLKENPVLAVTGGIAAILLLGFGLSKIARASDKANGQDLVPA